MTTEFGLIGQLAAWCRTLPANGFEGIGDDCALLPIGGGESLVFTADLLVEGVHFLREAVSPEELARKALHVNLSDVAAMGACPVATMLSLALPADTVRSDWAERFARGYVEASEQAGVNLIGGDTTASAEGVTINVTAIGRAFSSRLKRRDAARPGDLVLVTDRLGASGAGLREVLAGRFDTPLARLHHHPEAQIAEGVWLGGREEVGAMMDLSDGLASDLVHILERSGVGARIEIGQVPVAAGAGLEDALCGGEDYKLLFTAREEGVPALLRAFEARFGRPLYVVGRIVASDEPMICWTRDGQPFPADWQGFRHY